MFGNQGRLIAVDETPEAREMLLVERLRSSDRHAHAVQRQRVIAPDGFKGPMRRSSGAHVVLGVDFEEAPLSAFGKDRGEVLVLEACSGKTADQRRKAER